MSGLDIDPDALSRMSGGGATALAQPVVFLVDVDNTLLDNDGIPQDLKDHLERSFGHASRERYLRILEDLVDDKLRILAAAKRFWGERVTTVFPRQGSYARDPRILGAFPPADVTIEHIADLLERDVLPLRASRES